MAPASAPAGTVAIIEEYNAKGTLTKALYGVVGCDDGLGVLIFGFASTLAGHFLIGGSAGNTAGIISGLWEPAQEIGLSLALGAAIGCAFCLTVRELKNSHEAIILIFAAVLVGCGLSIRWDLSLILVNMVIGFMFINLLKGPLVELVSEPIQDIMPLVYLLFFLIAGAHLHIGALR